MNWCLRRPLLLRSGRSQAYIWRASLQVSAGLGEFAEYVERFDIQFVRAAFAARRRYNPCQPGDRFRVGRVAASRVLPPGDRRRKRQVDPAGDVEVGGPKLSRAVAVQEQSHNRKSAVARSRDGSSGPIHRRNREAQISNYQVTGLSHGVTETQSEHRRKLFSHHLSIAYSSSL